MMTQNTDKEVLEERVTKIREQKTSTVITISKLARALMTLRKAEYIEWRTVRINNEEYFEIRLLTKEEAQKKSLQ